MRVKVIPLVVNAKLFMVLPPRAGSLP